MDPLIELLRNNSNRSPKEIALALGVAESEIAARIAAAEADDELALVLMDVQMPVMGGFEATRCLREREATSGRHVPIVALTAHAMDGDRARCLAAGMDDHMTKPMRVSTLADVLQRWVP